MTQQGLATTPFGRRTFSLGLIATQQQARAVQPEKTVHKWKIFQAITEAKDKLGLPDRAIAVLSRKTGATSASPIPKREALKSLALHNRGREGKKKRGKQRKPQPGHPAPAPARRCRW
jgi:hypothetical protein